MLYLHEQHASGDYTVRLGWRAVGYRFTAQEFNKFEKRQKLYQFLFYGLVATVIVLAMDRMPPLLAEGRDGSFVTTLLFAAGIGALFRIILHIQHWLWVSDRTPCDAGLPYWERRNRSVEYALSNLPYFYLMFPVLAAGAYLMEYSVTSKVLFLMSAIFLSELVAIRVVWRKREAVRDDCN